jgi:hypothetical protein
MINSVVEWYRPGGREAAIEPTLELNGGLNSGQGAGAATEPGGEHGQGAQDAWDGERVADAVVRLAFDGLRVRRRPS